MAKESMIAREVKRAKMAQKYAAKRAQLKADGDYVGLSRLSSGIPLYIYAAKYDNENLTDFPVGCPSGTFAIDATGLPPIGTAFFLPNVIFNRAVKSVGESQDGQQIVTITGKATRMPSDTSNKLWFDGPLYKAV